MMSDASHAANRATAAYRILSNEYGITKSCYEGDAAKFAPKKENPF